MNHTLHFIRHNTTSPVNSVTLLLFREFRQQSKASDIAQLFHVGRSRNSLTSV